MKTNIGLGLFSFLKMKIVIFKALTYSCFQKIKILMYLIPFYCKFWHCSNSSNT